LAGQCKGIGNAIEGAVLVCDGPKLLSEHLFMDDVFVEEKAARLRPLLYTTK